MNAVQKIDSAGYSILPDVFSSEELTAINSAMSEVLALNANDESVLKGKQSPAFGARNILRLWPSCLSLLKKTTILETLQSILGSSAGLVRGLYFDKPPGHSWALPWHRDETIAVKAHGSLGVFTKPTRKAGVPHVIAPRELLEKMIAVRMHLDPMDHENGALKVIPESHRDESATRDAVTIECAAGDVLLMRPLLLHSSGHATAETTRHRRILHFECAPIVTLPDDYEWQDFLPLNG